MPREIESIREQADKLMHYICDRPKNTDLMDIRKQFRENVDSGNYVPGYIPIMWLVEDLIKGQFVIFTGRWH